ncbi:unnamed protein product [Cercospora beticola]|nr:unnamed protein product [Cercospora beticola]
MAALTLSHRHCRSCDDRTSDVEACRAVRRRYIGSVRPAAAGALSSPRARLLLFNTPSTKCTIEAIVP